MTALSDVAEYGKFFTRGEFWDKLKAYAKTAGARAVYYALQLYYTAQAPDTPAWARRTTLASLGYFIFPADAVPDFLPAVGYTDDVAVLAAALAMVVAHITPEIRREAANKVKQWFPDFEPGGEALDATVAPVTPSIDRIAAESEDRILAQLGRLSKDDLDELARIARPELIDTWADRLGIPRWTEANHAPGSAGASGTCTLSAACDRPADFSMRQVPGGLQERGSRQAVCREHIRDWLGHWQDEVNRGRAIDVW